MNASQYGQLTDTVYAGMQVSLADTSTTLDQQESDPLSTALEEAISALDKVQAGDSEPTSSRADLAPALELLAAMSRAPSRRDAAACLTRILGVKCADCEIRCGIGSERLARLYDARLGWLSVDSPTYRQIADDWTTPLPSDSKPSGDQASIRRPTVHRIEIHLPHRNGFERCVIWIDSRTDLSERLPWLQATCETIRVVLWSRPRTSWSSLAAKLAKNAWMTTIAATIVMTLLAVWPVHYRIPCTAVVETSAQRIVSTPFEASLLKTTVKPGDIVATGDVLLVLDGRPLRLEREAIAAERQQAAKEQDVALASGRIADAQQSGLRKQQLQRRYELLADRLNQLEVTSPIDGVVVSGDLEKHVGSVLERGQTLIEVAPMDRMIIEVEIPEHEIGYVHAGSDTRIKIDAIGGKSINSSITNLRPAAELREDKNVFVGLIEMDNSDGQLRPGMRGEAVTYGPLRPWSWSWVRSGCERVLWWLGY